MTLTDPTWVRPFWVERQADPRSADFVPAPADSDPRNCTHRSWTTVGTLAGPERATVDPRGLLAASIDRWSIDWWIGAEDDWHVPGRNEIVRQRLLGDAPVVETAMRVPGGDALHRVYGYNSSELGPCVVIELENRTAVPFAVALAIRPYDVLGRGTVSSIDLVEGTVFVNGAVAIVLPRPPAHTVASTLARGDAAAPLFTNAATAGWDGLVEDPAGAATAAFVFPLAHTAVLRVAVPLTAVPGTDAAVRRGVGKRRARSDAPVSLALPESLPTAEQVAKGWEAQTRRGLLVTVPDDRLQRAIEVTRNHLLLSHGRGEIVAPGAELDFASMARVVMALDDWGFDDEAAQALRRWSEMQALDGTFVLDGATADRRDATGAVLAALGRHWALTRDGALVEDLIGPVAKAVHRIDKDRSSRRLERDPHAVGLLPVGRGPASAGAGVGAQLRDNAIAIVGLRAIADAAAVDQPGVAAEASRVAAELSSALEALVEHLSAREGGAVPATPDRRVDQSVAANLDLIEPVGSLSAEHPVIAATLKRIRERLVVDGAVLRGPGPAGLDPGRTAALARAELRAGDSRCWDRLTWMLDHASLTGGWPSVIHPRTKGGAAGAPHDIEVNALFLAAVRDVLVRELIDPPTGQAVGLVLLGVIPPAWLGQPIDVRDAPTSFGMLSYSVRWHGDRPALLWEVVRHDDARPCGITAPGLDPRWSTTASSGEALLDAVPVPAEVQAEREGIPVEDAHAPRSVLGPGESPVAIDLRRKSAPSAEGPGASFQ